MQEVPRIDLCSEDKKTRAGRLALGNAIVESFRTFGFVRLINHGVGMEKPTVQAVYQRAKTFFALPEAQKLECVPPSKDGQAGFNEFGREHAKDSTKVDLKEFFTVGQPGRPPADFARLYATNIWPSYDVGGKAFREACLELYGEIENLAIDVLSLVSLALVDDEEWLASMAYGGDTKMRILRYPSLNECRERLPNAVIDGEIRSSPHEDINLITVLPGATADGLQIQMPDGTWLPIRTQGEEMVVNVGDMLSRVTNGILRSTTHRVENPKNEDEERFSIPNFIHPRPRVRLEVHPKLRGDDPWAPPILARTFLYERLREIGLLPPTFDTKAWETA